MFYIYTYTYIHFEVKNIYKIKNKKKRTTFPQTFNILFLVFFSLLFLFFTPADPMLLLHLNDILNYFLSLKPKSNMLLLLANFYLPCF